MSKKEWQGNLIEVMASNEEMIGQHYQVYAEKFKDYQDFWKRLAVEEGEHALWIRELNEEAQKGLMSIDEKRFNKESILEFQKHL